MTTKISLSQISTAGASSGQVLAVQANALTFSSSVSEAAGVVKISSIQIADSSYNVWDDTAVSTSGGYIIINGSGFASGCQVTIGSVLATSTTFISSTQIRAQVPAQAAGSYTVYVTNTDGSSGLRVNGLTYSVFPTWATNSTLTNQSKNSYFTINLSANSDSNVTYSLVSGSTLPFGANLYANGLIVGNVYVANDTTYSFTVAANDQESQNTNRTFSLTILATIYNTATGGTVTEVVEGDGKTYRIHTFNSSNSFVVSGISGANGNAEIMVVAGGGAGGVRHAGGGGGGGKIGPMYINLSATTYTVTIGAGGTSTVGSGGAPLDGSNSFISTPTSNILIAVGGGGGRNGPTSAPAPLQQDGRPGGSGGGSGYGGTNGGGSVSGQGTPGINWTPAGPYGYPSTYPGMGGGGAGGQPNKGYANFGKHGAYSSISGSNVAYSGGGGGGYYDSAPAITLAEGGIGGGGSGYPSSYPGGFPGVAPVANGGTNLGGGGGGAGQETQGGNGGSGIVIIKYPVTGLL